MHRTARALVYTAPGRVEIQGVALAAAGAGEVLVQARQGAISRGTEALVLAGRVPEAERERMRAPHQVGRFPFPVRYGYSVVGTLADGERVFCLHPHQTAFVVPRGDALPVPDDVPDRRAVLAPQIETALNATWDARPCPGDRIAVVGGGVIGCLVAWLCAAIPGTTVRLIDIDPSRAAVAARLGVTAGASEPGCDLVFHCSATASGLAHAIGLAGAEASVVELSWYGAGETPVALGGAFHSQRLTLRGSQVGRIAPERTPRWDHRRRLALALAMAADPRLDALVEAASPFEELPAVLPGLLGAGGALCHRILYPG